MIGGLNGLKGLDPKRKRAPREPEVISLGLAGICLETLMVPSGGYIILFEMELWSGPGYTGTRLTGSAYATKDSGGGVATQAFDGSGSTFWSADLSTGPAKIGIGVWPNPISYAGTLPVFSAMPTPKSFRILAHNEQYWCSAFRLYHLDATLVDGQAVFTWKVAGEFTGIPWPGTNQYAGVSL